MLALFTPTLQFTKVSILKQGKIHHAKTFLLKRFFHTTIGFFDTTLFNSWPF